MMEYPHEEFHTTCRFCGHEAQYDDISDGDFDTEKGECFPCSEENRESRENEETITQYSADGRRWACSRKVQDSEITSMALQIRYHESTTPEWMDPNVEPDCRSLWDRELSENTWYESMNSGLHVNFSTSSTRYDRFSENMQRVLREIDMRGQEIMQDKVGRWQSQLNMRPEMGIGSGLVKGIVHASPISCGGGGGF